MTVFDIKTTLSGQFKHTYSFQDILLAQHKQNMASASTTSTLGLPFHIPQAVFPTLVGLLSVTALGGGIFNFVNPLEGAKGFGLLPSKGGSQATLSPFEQAYIRVHGIRNVGVGLGNFVLLAYWAFSDNPAVGRIVRTCLGLGIVAGTVVGLGDAWILKQYAKDIAASTADVGDEKGAKEVTTLAEGKGTGHAVTAMVIFAVGAGMLLT